MVLLVRCVDNLSQSGGFASSSCRQPQLTLVSCLVAVFQFSHLLMLKFMHERSGNDRLRPAAALWCHCNEGENCADCTLECRPRSSHHGVAPSDGTAGHEGRCNLPDGTAGHEGRCNLHPVMKWRLSCVYCV